MSLDELRKRIDEIDVQLVDLLNERASVVVEIGKLKTQAERPIYAPDREKQVLDKVVKSNKGPLPDRTLVAIWREMMSGSFVLRSVLGSPTSVPAAASATRRPRSSSAAASSTSRWRTFARSSTRSARVTAIWGLSRSRIPPAGG